MNVYGREAQAPQTRKEPIRMLLEDHQLIHSLIAEYRLLRLEDQGKEDVLRRKEKICKSIINLLLVHECVEEEVLYARACKLMSSPAIVEEAVAEQKQARFLMQELRRMAITDSRYDQKFALLLEMVELHAMEEETQVFPAIERLPLDFQQIAIDMAVHKNELADKLSLS